MAMNDDPPGGIGGKSREDSNEAKDIMRFRRRETEEIWGSFIKMLYCSGRGGKSGGSLEYFPFFPQQNPGFSPVRSST
jgi:hypothetical protein